MMPTTVSDPNQSHDDPIQISLPFRTITFSIPSTIHLTFTLTNLTLRPVIIYPIISHQDQLFVTNSNTIKILQAFQQFNITIGLKSISIPLNELVYPKLRLYYWEVKNFTDEDEVVLEREEAVLGSDDDRSNRISYGDQLWRQSSKSWQQQRFVEYVNKSQIKQSILRKYKQKMFSPVNTSPQIFLHSQRSLHQQQQQPHNDNYNTDNLSQSSDESLQVMFSPLLYKQYLIEVLVDNNTLYPVCNYNANLNTSTTTSPRKQLYLIENIIQPEEIYIMSEQQKKQQIQFIQKKLFNKTQILGKVKAIDRLMPLLININKNVDANKMMQRYLIEYKQTVLVKDNTEQHNNTILGGQFIQILTSKHYYLFRMTKILPYDYNLINHRLNNDVKGKQTIINMRRKLPMIIDLNHIQLSRNKKIVQNVQNDIVVQNVVNRDEESGVEEQLGSGQDKQLVEGEAVVEDNILNKNNNVVSNEVGVVGETYVEDAPAVVAVASHYQRQYHQHQQQGQHHPLETISIEHIQSHQQQPLTPALQSALQQQQSQYESNFSSTQLEYYQQQQQYQSQLMEHYNNLQYELFTHEQREQLQVQSVEVRQEKQQSAVVETISDQLEQSNSLIQNQPSSPITTPKQLLSHRQAHHYDQQYHSRESLQKLSFLEQQQQLSINNRLVVEKQTSNNKESSIQQQQLQQTIETKYVDEIISYNQNILACYIYHNNSSSQSQKYQPQHPTAHLLFRTHLLSFPLANPQLQSVIKLDPMNQSDTINYKTILTPYINKSTNLLQQLIIANGCYIYWIDIIHKQSEWKYCQRKEIYCLEVIEQMGLLAVGGKNFSKLSYFGKQTSRSNIKIYTSGKPSHRTHLFTYDIPINDGNVGHIIQMKYITTPPTGGKLLCVYTNYNDQLKRLIFLRIRAYNTIEIYGNIQLTQIGIQTILTMKYNPKSMKLLILEQVDEQHTALKRLKVKSMYEKVQVLTECIKTKLGRYTNVEIGGDKEVQWYSLIKKDKSSALIYRENKFHNNPELITLEKNYIETVYDADYGEYVVVKGRNFIVIKRKKNKRVQQNFK